MTMKTVHLIETFQELCHAFNPVRSGDGQIPRVEPEVKLHCNFGDIEFKGCRSKLFVISDELKPKAQEFLLFLMTSPYSIPEDRLLIDEKFES
jgi:hypothetical protein